MKANSVRAIIAKLNGAGARYLIVGVLAVVAHGYVRYTSDVDLVIALDAENVHRCMNALASLGYRPRVPVSMDDFADAALREEWIQEKGMIVFQLFSDPHIETPVDVFVSIPFDFEQQWVRAPRLPVLGGETATVVPVEELLAMKRAAGRDQDLIDISKLRKLLEDQSKGSP